MQIHVVDSSLLCKKIFLFLGNTWKYSGLKDHAVYIPYPQIVQKTNYAYPYTKKERKKKNCFM